MHKTAIWTPINSQSGFGHFYRMLGLYEALISEKCPILYFTNQEFLNLENVDILSLITNDIEKISTYLQSKNIKTLIIDNYLVEEKDISFLNKKFSIIYFDAKFQNINVDAIINFNPYSVDQYPIKHKNTKYFLGMKYMFFRNTMTQVKKTNTIKDSIFLNIGGSDVAFITYKIIPFLPKHKFYNIVLGKGCSTDYYNKVSALLNQSNLNYKLFHHPKDYFKILSESENAIISCSTTSYELIYLSKPFVCINVVDNQNSLTDYLNGQDICTLTEDTLQQITEIIEKNKFSLPKNMELGLSNSKKLISYIKRLNDE